jgi:predicted PurR-regulated permease PerM
MFNVHLPALLKKILSSSPALAAESREELLLNIGKIIREAESIFKEVISSWLGGVDSVLSQSYLKLGLYIVANLFFLLVGLCILTSRRKQLRAYDAFFKFEKEEVEKKVGRIKWYVKSIEGQVRRWNLFKEFNAYVKEADIFNLEFENIRVTYEPKIGFEVSEEKEQQIKNGESCRYAANLMVVVLTQVIFYVVYVSLNNQFIETLRNTPQEVNGCSKSMVVPSLLLVSIEQQVPKTILDSYLNQTSVCLAKTIASLPNFLSFVATAPCPNCSFLYPLLTTNYVSFFHSFLGMVTLSRNSSVPPYDFSDMTEAGAVVSQNIGE